MAYETKYKERVLSYLSEGHTQQEASRTYGVGITAIKEWKRRSAANESLEPKKRKRQPKKIAPNELKAYVAAHPDAYLTEIAAHFNCTGEAVRQALQRLKITRKKRRYATESGTKRVGERFEK